MNKLQLIFYENEKNKIKTKRREKKGIYFSNILFGIFLFVFFDTRRNL